MILKWKLPLIMTEYIVCEPTEEFDVVFSSTLNVMNSEFEFKLIRSKLAIQWNNDTAPCNEWSGSISIRSSLNNCLMVQSLRSSKCCPTIHLETFRDLLSALRPGDALRTRVSPTPSLTNLDQFSNYWGVTTSIYTPKSARPRKTRRPALDPFWYLGRPALDTFK